MHRVQIATSADLDLLLIFLGHGTRHGQFLLLLLALFKGRALASNETFELCD